MPARLATASVEVPAKPLRANSVSAALTTSPRRSSAPIRTAVIAMPLS